MSSRMASSVTPIVRAGRKCAIGVKLFAMTAVMNVGVAYGAVG